MAMEDFFKKNACTRIVQTETINRYGNRTILDTLGSKFDGLLVTRSRGEEKIGANRGIVSDKYNLYVPANVEVAKDEKLVYNYMDGQSVYIRLTSNAILNDEASGQTGWKTFEAESYTPVGGNNEQ